MPQEIVDEDPRVWEEEILAYEAADRLSPPPRGAVLFVGSSTVRMWKTLARDMAPLPVVNRGFGGAQTDAVLHYAPRLVLPHSPVAVVLASGENDLEPIRGKSAHRVLADVRAVADLLFTMPALRRLYVLAIKRSPARSASWDEADRCNALLAAEADADARLGFVDVATPMLDEDGMPQRRMFMRDGLHLSKAGYAVWTSVLRPRLLADARLGGWFARSREG